MVFHQKLLVPTTEKVEGGESFQENEQFSVQPRPTARDDNHVLAPSTSHRSPKAKKSPLQLSRKGKKRDRLFMGKTFPCKICLRPFNNATSAHTPLNPDELERSSIFHEKCPHCEKVFFTRHQLTNHVNAHEGRKNHACPTCKQKFTQKPHLTAHLFVHMSGEERAEVRQRWRHVCYFCSKRFKILSHLSRHLLVHTKEKLGGRCHVCGKSFSLKQILARHRFTHLSEDEKVALVKQGTSRECLFCQKKFPDNSTYHKHLVSHTKEKPFRCDQCGKLFPRSKSLQLHKLIHTSEQKLFNCDECEKAFTSKQNLVRHEKTVHRGLKDIACSECAKKFGTKGDMVRHVKSVHTNIRHPCPHCGVTFTQKCHLGRHLKKLHA
ncbi:zinc finger protein 708 [Folsomia candida]|nr:zinc finger protein 708 [Folsomia candida]